MRQALQATPEQRLYASPPKNSGDVNSDNNIWGRQKVHQARLIFVYSFGMCWCVLMWFGEKVESWKIAVSRMVKMIPDRDWQAWDTTQFATNIYTSSCTMACHGHAYYIVICLLLSQSYIIYIYIYIYPKPFFARFAHGLFQIGWTFDKICTVTLQYTLIIKSSEPPRAASYGIPMQIYFIVLHDFLFTEIEEVWAASQLLASVAHQVKYVKYHETNELVSNSDAPQSKQLKIT